MSIALSSAGLGRVCSVLVKKSCISASVPDTSAAAMLVPVSKR